MLYHEIEENVLSNFCKIKIRGFLFRILGENLLEFLAFLDGKFYQILTSPYFHSRVTFFSREKPSKRGRNALRDE